MLKAGDSHFSNGFYCAVSKWKEILWRTWFKIGHNNTMLVAAGVAFYSFLAFVPLLAAVALTYGLFADASDIAGSATSVLRIVPDDAATLILDQLNEMVKVSKTQKGWGLALAFGFAIFGATRAASAVISALNMAYECIETRSFIKLNLLTIVFTLGFVLVILVMLVAVTSFAFVKNNLAGIPSYALLIGTAVASLIMVLFSAAVVATIYRYGPNRRKPKWRWISPGSLFTTIGGLGVSSLFGIYVSNFAGYNATYGALGAVVVLLMWLWLCALTLCVGAELNAAVESVLA